MSACKRCGGFSCHKKCFLKGRTAYCHDCRITLKNAHRKTQERIDKWHHRIGFIFDFPELVLGLSAGAVIVLGVVGFLGYSMF
jgi:hypothetical protein